jgi:hypothetical protein
MRKCISLTLILLLTTLTFAHPVLQELSQNQSKADAELTNKDVVDMHTSGLADEIIIAKIRTSPSRFDTAPAALTTLKAAGLSDSVLTAMVHGRLDPAVALSASMVDVETKVPDGTEIEIQIANTLSGQQAKIGDMVDFIILRPVQVNGVTVFERDAPARARITTAKKSGRWGKAGKLEWAMQDVQSLDGKRVPARFTKRELGDSKGGTVAVATLATAMFLGPVALFWGLKKGRPAIIPAGTRYSVFVHGDATIKGKAPSLASSAR